MDQSSSNLAQPNLLDVDSLEAQKLINFIQLNLDDFINFPHLNVNDNNKDDDDIDDDNEHNIDKDEDDIDGDNDVNINNDDNDNVENLEGEKDDKVIRVRRSNARPRIVNGIPVQCIIQLLNLKNIPKVNSTEVEELLPRYISVCGYDTFFFIGNGKKHH